MHDHKKLSLIALSGVIVLGSAIIANQGRQSFTLSAADCSHGHVEYYAGHTDSKTGDGYVEHWACCTCHTAWADAQRTTVIGNTSTERDNIDLDYGFKVDWGARNMVPTFGGTGVAVFTDDKFSISSEGNDPYYFVEKFGSKILEENEYAEVTLLNNSSADILNVSFVNSGDWNDHLGLSQKQLAKGLERKVFFSSEQWAKNPGFIIKEPSKAETNGSLVFKVSFGKVEPYVQDGEDILYQSCAVNSNLNGWASFTNEIYETRVITIADAPTGGFFDVIVNGTGGLEAGKYSDVKFKIFNPNDFNIGLTAHMSNSSWGALDYQDCGTLTPGWNEIHILPSKLENSLTHFITLRLNFTNGGNSDGWLITKFVGVLKPEETRTITFGEGGITLQSETVTTPTKWPSCTKIQINDPEVGLAYKYNASEFAGDVKGNQLYWVMAESQVANVVAGFGSEMDIYVPDDGNTYQFAFQCGDTSTAWHETPRKGLIGGQWNHIVINQEWLSGLDFTGAGNVAFVRLYGGDFQTNDIKLTPIYKIEGVKTSLSLGTLTDTETDHELLGNIYDYARKVDFKDSTSDLNTISLFDPVDFTSALGEDKEELVFEIYNPTDADYSIHFAGGAEWTDGSTTTLKAKQWTRVKITKEDIAIGKTGRIYVYINGFGDQTGWQVTDIWAI